MEGITEIIRKKALELGFDACGFAHAHKVDDKAISKYSEWIADGKNDCMDYATRYQILIQEPSFVLFLLFLPCESFLSLPITQNSVILEVLCVRMNNLYFATTQWLEVEHISYSFRLLGSRGIRLSNPYECIVSRFSALVRR